MTHITLSQFSLERLIKNDSDFSNVVQMYNAMGDNKKKETKIEKKDEFGKTVEEKKIEEKEED